MSRTKTCSGRKNKLHFTRKKLYEYAGGNQVDGLPPVSSFFFVNNYKEIKISKKINQSNT